MYHDAKHNNCSPIEILYNKGWRNFVVSVCLCFQIAVFQLDRLIYYVYEEKLKFN